MNVVVPYTNLPPLLPWLLQSYGIEPRLVDLRGGDHTYWSLLRSLWEARETVVVVEHDILPWPGAIEELSTCPGIWCANSYDQRGIGIFHSFGCVKFSKALMEQTPTIWDEIQDRYWSKLDAQFEFLTYQQGIRPHHHRPPVIHLHNYEAALDQSS